MNPDQLFALKKSNKKELQRVINRNACYLNVNTHAINIDYKEEYKNQNNCIVALQTLKTEIEKTNGSLSDDKFAETVHEIIEAAKQLMEFFSEDMHQVIDKYFNEEMVLLTESIDLLHKKANNQEVNPEQFIHLMQQLSQPRKNIDIDNVSMSKEDEITKFLIYLGIGLGILAMIVLVASVFSFLIAPPFLDAAFFFGGFAVGGGIGVLSMLLEEFAKYRINQEAPNQPSRNLVKTFFAAVSVAEVCDVKDSSVDSFERAAYINV